MITKVEANYPQDSIFEGDIGSDEKYLDREEKKEVKRLLFHTMIFIS